VKSHALGSFFVYKEGGGARFMLFLLCSHKVLIKFSLSSQYVPQVFNVFPNMFPLELLQTCYLDFQVRRQYLHEIKKLTCFGFVLMLGRIEQQSPFSFKNTLDILGPHPNDYRISMGWPLDEFWRFLGFRWSWLLNIM